MRGIWENLESAGPWILKNKLWSYILENCCVLTFVSFIIMLLKLLSTFEHISMYEKSAI